MFSSNANGGRSSMRWFLALFVSLLGLLGSTSLAAKPEGLAIVGATVIYPERDDTAAVSPRMTIVVRRARIDAVGPAATTPVPIGFTVINGTGKWVIPGLIDGHVHFFQSGNLYTRPDAADFNSTMPYAKEVARNKARLSATFKVWLASGVTGVVDVGGPFWNFDVRAQARATDAAPRVAVAGPLISMVDDPKLDLGDPPIVKIASPDAARDMVKRAELGHHGGAPNVVSLLPQAAKLYTTQLEWGLGHPAHTADARAALKRLVGGRITLQRGKTAGSLFAAYNFQRTALLAGVQVQRGSGAGFLKKRGA